MHYFLTHPHLLKTPPLVLLTTNTLLFPTLIFSPILSHAVSNSFIMLEMLSCFSYQNCHLYIILVSFQSQFHSPFIHHSPSLSNIQPLFFKPFIHLFRGSPTGRTPISSSSYSLQATLLFPIVSLCPNQRRLLLSIISLASFFTQDNSLYFLHLVSYIFLIP